MSWRNIGLLSLIALAGCQSSHDQRIIASLDQVQPDIADVVVDDSLRKALAGYQQFLQATPEHRMAPEAMRRLADLKLERDYGYVGGTLSQPESARGTIAAMAAQVPAETSDNNESDVHFEQRASQVARRERAETLHDLPVGTERALSGPLEAIATYQRVLEEYPWYERNDQVLYQMARAYDELAQPEQAMAVIDRLLAQYPDSKYVDEVLFRRGEYHFVRRDFLDAESAYQRVVERGAGSDYFELALYKLGWAFYKQDLYEEALHRFMGLLDHKRSQGYDFDAVPGVAMMRDGDGEGADASLPSAEAGEDERRVADTFRIVSLSFSNLGGPQVPAVYFERFGMRSYEHRIYRNLAEFHFAKRRFNDAAQTYDAFVALYPLHRLAPNFSVRMSEIYADGGFPLLVVQAKRDFSQRYGLESDYWQHFAVDERADVVGYLKANLVDLAEHYHALYQSEDAQEQRPEHFAEARRWYGDFLRFFAQDSQAPDIHYQFADLLRENADHAEAAIAYEQVAYDYPEHDQSADAGYAAVFAHREHLKQVDALAAPEVQLAAISSSLRFADRFAAHEQAATVLTAAVEDLFALQDYERAIASAGALIEGGLDATALQRRAAWMIVAHSSFELERFAEAEQGYAAVLDLTEPDDAELPEVVENLAAAIYRQGEAARDAGDFAVAAAHFLRIRKAAPASGIRAGAEYDAAAAYVQLEQWQDAAVVFEAFRSSHPEHELAAEATRQLASVYEQSGSPAKAAYEYERVAAEAEQDALAREALLVAGDLYEQAETPNEALRIYQQYVAQYPQPLDPQLEIRAKIAGYYERNGDTSARFEELRKIVALDASAGSERSDRSRYLAATAALTLTEGQFDGFAQAAITQPLEQSLAAKQQLMETALSAFEQLISYEVAQVTAAATYYIAEIYRQFGADLAASERPAGLAADELLAYEEVIAEEVRPLTERAVATHEGNLGLLRRGVYNAWITRSLERLSDLWPERYARAELSSGYMASLDAYAYRTPGAPDPNAVAAGPAIAGAGDAHVEFGTSGGSDGN